LTGRPGSGGDGDAVVVRQLAWPEEGDSGEETLKIRVAF